ncbi:MAG TPA: hypothetical protein PKA42_01560 [Candidatus Paceibacterota bacterium]|mgnify:CR=1 FL=1|nr:hypothetical protein [Candidatus Paceibacterota bacterium]HMO82831.1 hypothetical protein [Candidatus Paceibacterota bacterium]
MDKELTKKLISEAQKYLEEKPQDLFHDFLHHARVWKLAQQLVTNEQLDSVDTDILELICWWHDVEVPDIEHSDKIRVAARTARYLSDKVSLEYREIVFDSVKNHEFGLMPRYLEGKILQDADKLEVLSLIRANNALPMVESGRVSKDEMLSIHEMVVNKWLPIMPDLYHFDFSRKFHAKHVSAAIAKWNEIKEKLQRMK